MSRGRSDATTLLTAAAERRGVRVSGGQSLDEIAALIGGIPLALELAACQLQYLEPAALLRSLQDPIETLVDPRRAVGRHRSMRACFELARARLSRDATDLFAIVSRRPAGAPYDDLLACWSRATPLSRTVAELVEAGFASTTTDSAGATRLTQLPLVRSYGRTMPHPDGRRRGGRGPGSRHLRTGPGLVRGRTTRRTSNRISPTSAACCNAVSTTRTPSTPPSSSQRR